MKKTTPFIVGNWKLNPLTQKAAAELAAGVARRHKKTEAPYIAIAPSAVHMSEVSKKIKNSTVMLAAQSISFYDGGAHTGEESVGQVKDLGSEFIIVGHSERRAGGVTDEDVNRKVAKILRTNLVPIVCIGERKRDEQGAFFTFVEEQLRSLAEQLSAASMKKIVIAYEPIWAIGTGKTATAEDVKEMQLFIESVLTKLYNRPTARSVRLLYGGSVKPHNAKELHADGGMNGFLVGGASLKAEDFIAIARATE